MSHYRATDQSGNVIEYDAELPQPEHLGPGWMLESVTEASSVPDPEAPVPTPLPIKITKRAFRGRFTQAEKIAIEIAALDDPTAPMQSRAMAAALRANQADVASAEFVDLNFLDTREGVQALEQFGLVAPGRALVILDTPPTEKELFYGQ